MQSKNVDPTPLLCCTWQVCAPLDPQQAVPGQHRPLHTGCPAPQEPPHDPPLQVCPDEHLVPHDPQLAGFVWRSTHVVPHGERPLAHPHWPEVQT